MNYITWKNDSYIIGGTSLRNKTQKENGNLALHVGGNLEDIIQNRKDFSDTLGIDIKQWVFPQQTHSDHILEVTKDDCAKGVFTYESGITDCDAIYTKDKHVALGIFHADCVPILLYDPMNGIICAIHSGWQGTVKEITRKAIETLVNNEQCIPSNLHAFIGPAIGYTSFEVQADVIEKVQTMSFDTTAFMTPLKDGKAHVDCKGLNNKMLLDAGILEENITIDKNDTFTNNESLFSFRRDATCGRHITFIMKK